MNGPEVENSPRVNERLARLRTQRDQVIACAILSLTLSVAILVNTFGPPSKELIQARALVAKHRALLTQVQGVLRQNQAALRQNEAALAQVKKAVEGNRP